jgi:hypothetical protein
VAEKFMLIRPNLSRDFCGKCYKQSCRAEKEIATDVVTSPTELDSDGEIERQIRRREEKDSVGAASLGRNGLCTDGYAAAG